jgi:zinc transport system substrate-binding protein
MVFAGSVLMQKQFPHKEDCTKIKIMLAIVFAGILLVAVTACQRQEQQIGKIKQLTVVTTLFPLYDFTKTIAGDKASITLLLPPGVEAHSFEPKAGDMLKVNGADLFIFTGKFMEPWADGLLKGVDSKGLLVVDASTGITLMEGEDKHHDHGHGKAEKHKEGGHHDHGKIDPHIWLDFGNAQKMVNTIREALIAKDPANKDYYAKNADAFIAKLADLDRLYEKSFSSCKKSMFVHGGHFAFNYLAKRYNLTYISAYQGSPDSEPTPKRIINLKKMMQDNNIQYIYYEELITPRVADVLARETGAKLLKLHGAHNISKEEFEKGITFLSIMEENLKNLTVGLECQ